MSSHRNLSGLGNNITNNIYVNTLNNFTGVLPLEVSQGSTTDPVNISIKGLNGFTANKLLKVNSAGTALEYADDTGSNWTISGNNIYPTTASRILVNTTSNPNQYGIIVLDKEIAIQTTAGSGSSNGLRIIKGTNSVINYVDNSGNMFWSGAVSNYNFSRKLILNFTGAELSNGTNDFTLPSSTGTLALTSQIPNVSNFITASSTDTLTNKSISYTQLTGTPTIPTNNNELSNGAGYITASSTDTLTNKSLSYSQLTGTPTIPTNNSSLTNGAGYITATSTDTLTNKSISYTQLTGTPTIPTIPANVIANGKTGLTSYTQGDILYYNSGTTLSKLPIGTAGQTLKVSSGGIIEWGTEGGSNWTLNSGNLYPTNFSTTTVSINTTGAESGYVFKVQGHQYNNGNIRLNGNLETRNGTSGINYNTGNIQKIVSGSVNATYSFPSSTGTLALTSEIPTNNNQLTNGQAFITASSTDTLTNKSLSYSQLTGTPTIPTNNSSLTNGAGYITATSTDTLTNKSISYTQLTGTPTIPVASSVATQLATNTGSTNYSISVGQNDSVSPPTVNTNFYTSLLKIHNTSAVEIAKFTPVSNSADLSLNGGNLKLCNFQGTPIAINYGGTGKQTIDLDGQAGKYLRVATNETSYDFENVVENTADEISFGTNTQTGERSFGNVGFLSTMVGSSCALSNTNQEIELDSSGFLRYNNGTTTHLFCSSVSLSTTNPMLFTNTTSTSGFYIDAKFSNQANGTNNFIAFGASENGIGNRIQLDFYYAGNESASNYGGIGLDGNTSSRSLIKLYREGNTEIDSRNNNILKCNGSNRLFINNSGIKTIMIGQKAEDGTAGEVALHICNKSNTTSYAAARIRIESKLSTRDPVLEIVSNIGTDSATRRAVYFYGNSSGDAVLSVDTASRYFIIYPRIISNTFNYFMNMNGTTGFQLWGAPASIATTGSFFWRQWINSQYNGNNGNFLFDYSTQNGSWGQRAYISSGTSGYIQMNFTGQHRCVPQEGLLYDNVDSYIGMVVESTGQYNSMDFVEYEETITGEEVQDAYIDPTTGIHYPETKTPTSRIEKKTRVEYTTEPTINDCEPIVKLTTTAKSKKVFGVISNKEDNDSNGNRSFLVGNFGSTFGLKTDNRLYINSVGEGGVLVNNENGNIENGDLLCSSSTTGIAMKQDDDIVRNYTIGKATMDYNFTGNENKLIGCVYYCG